MHVCKRFLRRFVAQLTGYALRAWARATRRAERCTIATFSSLARCVHDPLRALRRLNQLGAWRALQTWVVFTTSTVFLEGQRRASAATVIRLLVDGGWRLKRAALLAWVDRCTRVRAAERACRLVKRVVGRLEHGAEATAMRTWAAAARAIRDEGERNTLQHALRREACSLDLRGRSRNLSRLHVRQHQRRISSKCSFDPRRRAMGFSHGWQRPCMIHSEPSSASSISESGEA